jgi:hypothetical protein
METAAFGLENGVDGFIHAETALRVLENEDIGRLCEGIACFQFNVNFWHFCSWAGLSELRRRAG